MSSWQCFTNAGLAIQNRLWQIVRQVLDELRRAIQVGDITPGAYREIKAKVDHRMERLERKSKKPLLDGLALRAQA